MNMRAKTGKSAVSQWFDPWVALIALSAITLVSVRLWATEWTGDLYILVYLTFIAGLTGIALGYSVFSPLICAVFSIVYGIFTIGWLFGTTVEMEMSWYDRILNYLGWRLQIAIQQFADGKALTDPILFLTLMAILLWILGSTTAFILMREGAVWAACVPLGMTLLVISQYDQDLARNSRFLITFLFLTLLAVGRMNFLRNKQEWHKEGIYTTTETHADLNKALLIVTIVLLILAWIIPAAPQSVNRYSQFWETLKEPWQRFSEKVSDIFVLESAATPSSSGFFGDSMGLGSGTPASETVIFIVNVISQPPAGYSHYWRTRSYDHYDNANWSTAPGLDMSHLFPDNFSIDFPDWQKTQLASYAFTIMDNRIDNLYFTGEPSAINRPVLAITQSLPDSQSDLIALLPDPILTEGEVYTIETGVRLPSQAELRSTSIDYPDWLDRYLQLPANFSPRVAALAADITEDADHPYDKAAAITRYLRINIEYVRTIPPVPPGADPIEWFLFEQRSGFCNYYATAQVLMLRSLGIPARMSVGYAQGDFDQKTDTYTVQRRDSHAWPEVYFPDYGWVIFEPTRGQPAVILPLGMQSAQDESPLLPGDTPLMDDPLGLQDDGTELAPGNLPKIEVPEVVKRFESRWIIWTILFAFLIGLVMILLIIIRPNIIKFKTDPIPVLLERMLIKHGKSAPNWLRRWRMNTQMSVAQKAYRQMRHAIRLLKIPLKESDTPAERAETLIRLLPEAKIPILEILNEYHLDQFSDHIINEERARKAARRVTGLALRARVQSIFSFTANK